MNCPGCGSAAPSMFNEIAAFVLCLPVFQDFWSLLDTGTAFLGVFLPILPPSATRIMEARRNACTRSIQVPPSRLGECLLCAQGLLIHCPRSAAAAARATWYLPVLQACRHRAHATRKSERIPLATKFPFAAGPKINGKRTPRAEKCLAVEKVFSGPRRPCQKTPRLTRQ